MKKEKPYKFRQVPNVTPPDVPVCIPDSFGKLYAYSEAEFRPFFEKWWQRQLAGVPSKDEANAREPRL